ncbi:META domain-containing protein [Psychrobacter sp. A3]|uniref:META domain-containing protein n=1 Tax=Psychrobacter sp. A3 TaxID=2992754 RepID=UPI00237B909C|nr:META domain-containing protein [Psychrobacter sp. A3]MDE0490741.1 META domain-containing protein [Psychrobacter sp. A3]
MKNMTKMIMGATFVIGALTAGCQTTATLPAPVSQPVTETALQAHNWQLVDAKRMNGERVTALFFDPAKPLTLSFMNDNGRNYVAFMNTCNNMSAGYSVVNGNVQIKNGISTMMACPEPQASFDTAAVATVQGKYSLSKNAKKVPILTIKNDNQVAYFKAVSK